MRDMADDGTVREDRDVIPAGGDQGAPESCAGRPKGGHLPGDRPRALALNRQTGITLGMVVILALLPLGLGDSNYTMRLLVIAMIWGAVAVAWDLLLGYAGIFNLGQVGFFALGAYASAMLVENAGLNPWWGLLAGAAAGGVIAVLLGMPSLRLAGIYVALLTLAFYEVLSPLLTVGEAIGTGGKRGISPITPYSIGGYTFTGDNQVPWYYIALGLFVFCLMVCYFAINSRFGASFIALHDSEAFAQSLGISRYKVSLLIVGLSGLLTGLMGAFYAHYTGVVSPRVLGLEVFIYLVIMVLLGGVGKFPGPAIGAFIVIFVSDWLRQFERWRMLIFGALVVILVMVAPRGIMGAVDSVQAFVRRLRARRSARTDGEASQ
jgi:branched-chain amino acid transport system permease protein